MTHNNIRNFCIIAHIDHGKSTLADRFLELTKTVEKRKMKEQLLDQLDLERERGITIKLQPVRMNYQLSTINYELNLIDTPGHVDFTYEVSRSLAAVEGAILLVDSTQGVQAQTIANLYLALEQDLKIIPVINKIDLPNSDPERTKKEICKLIDCQPEDILAVSAKTGKGVEEVLQKVIAEVPPPTQETNKPLQALIFDSQYDDYKGVVAYTRIVSGAIKSEEKIFMLGTGANAEVLELGILKPQLTKTKELKAGEIGYIATGLKKVERCRIGDTITLYSQKSRSEPLPGYKEVKPMVFAGIFCKEGTEYRFLREGIEKLKLNDAALFFEPERSQALGPGFRCGFLGLLHLEIVQERLKREHKLGLVVTVPSVAYKVEKMTGEKMEARSPQELPLPSQIKQVSEPWVAMDVITPSDYLGKIMALVEEKRGVYKNTEYLDERRVMLHYELPLASILTDFYDKLKSVSSGFASLNYEFMDYRECEVVKLDILVAEEPVEALASIVYKDEAQRVGRKIVESLKESIPKAWFQIKLQAAIGGKIVAAERLSALRKDVTAKLYGGDVTRRQKLLKKQKKGKKKMEAMGKGKVNIPTEAFLAVLKR